MYIYIYIYHVVFFFLGRTSSRKKKKASIFFPSHPPTSPPMRNLLLKYYVLILFLYNKSKVNPPGGSRSLGVSGCCKSSGHPPVEMGTCAEVAQIP